MKNLFLGIVIGGLAMFAGLTLTNDTTVTEEQKIAAYYANSAATLVSPHNLRERMVHGVEDFILVDVRAQADYERAHIVGAVNIDTGRDLAVVLNDFQKLVTENPNKEIVVYCYSAACMNGRKAGNFLADNGVYVKEMTVGWNEWRYGWEMWNYDTEWEEYGVLDFIATGTEPGVVPNDVKSLAPCGVEGELSC